MTQTDLFVVSDVEGTLTAGVMWQAISAYLRSTGREAEDKRFLRRNLWGVLRYRLGWIDREAFKNRWITSQAQLLAGSSQEEIEALAEWVMETSFWPARRQEVLDELAGYQAQGAQVVLASGLYQPIVAAFATRLGLPALQAIGTPLGFVEGVFSGEFAGPICNGEEKARQVRAYVGEGKILAAYGDSLSDVYLLEMSEMPVAVDPEPELAAEAQRRGWRILTSDAGMPGDPPGTSASG